MVVKNGPISRELETIILAISYRCLIFMIGLGELRHQKPCAVVLITTNIT